MSIISLSLLLLPAVLAVDFSRWAPPGPGDVRSPCPGLNSLANHGILPRNGRNMTFDVLIPGLRDGLSVGPDFTLAIGSAGMLANPRQNLAAPYFDLDMLDQHDFPIEHDFSLSRADYFFGDDHTFNQRIWNTVLSYGQFQKKGYFDLATAAKARFMRVEVSRLTNPTFTYLPQSVLISYGETALYVSTMGNNTNKAPYEYVQSLFEQEKLPYELGWRPATSEITLFTLGVQILQEIAATGEILPPGLQVTSATVAAAFQGRNPITGQLSGTSHQ